MISNENEDSCKAHFIDYDPLLWYILIDTVSLQLPVIYFLKKTYIPLIIHSCLIFLSGGFKHEDKTRTTKNQPTETRYSPTGRTHAVWQVTYSLCRVFYIHGSDGQSGYKTIN